MRSETPFIESREAPEPAYPLLRGEASTVRFFAAHGLDIEKKYTKEELTTLGYAMYNRVGDGQVPIVKQIEGQDVREDALLTKEQLEQHIRESLPEGIDLAELPAIEADMKVFMNEVGILVQVHEYLDPKGRGRGWMRNYIWSFLDDIGREFPDWVVTQRASNAKISTEMNNIVEKAMKAVADRYSVPDNVRGIPRSMIDERKEGAGVFGNPCPCMQCRAVFPREDGIKIYDDGRVTGTPGQVRMNSIVRHLAGHGVNNNENQTVDRDHRYMTIREYMKIYESRDPEDEKILRLNPKKIAMEVTMEAFRNTRHALGLDDGPLTDEILEEKVREYFFVPALPS